MTELKTLAAQDPIKSAQDVINYNGEFKDLQSQLFAVSQSQFNDVSLFDLIYLQRIIPIGDAIFNIERYNQIVWKAPHSAPSYWPLSNDDFDNTITVDSGEESGLALLTYTNRHYCLWITVVCMRVAHLIMYPFRHFFQQATINLINE